MSITFETPAQVTPLEIIKYQDIGVLFAHVFDEIYKNIENHEDLEKLAYLTQDTLRWACDETRGGMGLDKTCQYFSVPGYGKFAEGHEPSFKLKLAQIIQLYQKYLDLKKDPEDVDASSESPPKPNSQSESKKVSKVEVNPVLVPIPNSQIAKILPPLLGGDYTKPMLGSGDLRVNGLRIVAGEPVPSILSGSKHPAKYQYLTPGTVGSPARVYQDLAMASMSGGLGDYELQLVFDDVALKDFETSSSDIRTLLAILSDPEYFNKFVGKYQKHWILGITNDCGLRSGLRLGVNIVYEDNKKTRLAKLRIWDEKEAKDNHDNFNDKKALCAFGAKYNGEDLVDTFFREILHETSYSPIDLGRCALN